MLEKIQLVNFQKHKNLTVEFDQFSTVIVGPTNAGKSSILRAIEFVFLNKWSSAYLRHGAKFVLVRVWIDGHKITRKKGGRTNTYSLDGKVFKAFGQSKVPPKIETLLNIGFENFQKQFDSHFWFNDTPGIVSKKLNKVVDLSLIDTALAYSASMVAKKKADTNNSQERIKETRDSLKELKWIRSFMEEMERLETARNGIDAIRQKSDKIAFLSEKLSRLHSREDNANKAMLDAKKTASTAREITELADVISRLNDAIAELAKTRQKMTLPDISPLTDTKEKLNDLYEKHGQLDRMIEELVDSRKQRIVLCSDIEDTENKIRELTKGKCPLCQRPLKNTPLPSCSPTCTSGRTRPLPVPRKTKNGS